MPATAPAGLPFARARYYPASQLTRHPQPITPIELDQPELKPFVASGKVILTLWISDRGEVVNIEAKPGELPPVFAESAVSVFRHARFQPGELDGRAVGSMMRIEVAYDDVRLPGR